MATSPQFKPGFVYDYIRSVEGGHSNGVDPLLLKRNEFSFFRNGTVRGTFPTHRPAYLNVPLSFSAGTTQPAFEVGLFQGAGYYKPDFGNESIIVAISGRLFQIQISGSSGAVTDISIVNDQQSSSAPQVWMWQAEKWMIVNDSFGLPIFFDGNSSRRSTGAAQTVGTINATFNAPAIGATVNVTFSTAFSGPFNVPLRLTAADGTTGLFMAVSTTGSFTGYPVTLQNISESTGIVEASASQLVADASVVATVNANQIPFTAGVDYHTTEFGINSVSFFGMTVGQVVTIAPLGAPAFGATVTSEFIGSFRAKANASQIFATNTAIASGTSITTPGTGTTLVALLNAPVTAPASGSTVASVIDRAYSGSLPQVVYINGRQYKITSVSSPTPSTGVTLLNLTATAGTNNFPANVNVKTLAELPAGRMGAYGLGRVWQALTDGRSFIGGDIVGGDSGTATYSKRDAVLHTEENNLIAGGGTFVVPGQVGGIRAMIFASTLDTSLGQGPLAVVTPNIVFSCQAPADRTTWQNLTTPIVTESMKGGGGLGQNSTITFNSDIIMRAIVGLRSFIQGRRDFDVWGNVPISREVDPTLLADDASLLQFTSAVEFDNRLLLTTNPTQSALGVYWSELVALNADAISSLRGKAPSVYDGIWDGLNVLQLVKGFFGGVERCFAVCVNSDLTKIELWEILKSADDAIQDNNVDPIVWDYETAAINFYENDPRKRDFVCLLDGELRIDRLDKTLYEKLIDGPHVVMIQSFWRSEQSLDWTPWHLDTIEFDPGTDDPGYRYAIGFGEPSGKVFDTTNNLPLRHGSIFQFKFTITGHCRVVLHRFKARTVPELDFAPVKD